MGDMTTIALATAIGTLTLASVLAGPAGAQTYPADKPELEFLDYWRLDSNLPTGTNYQDALTKSSTELNAFSDSYFRVVTGGGVSMRARFGGSVTSTGTAYARTELREMADASTAAAWACTSKAKQMFARIRIKTTGRYKPEMSVAQIHDASSDVLEVLYIYDPAQNGGAVPATGAIGDKGKIIAAWNGTRTGATTLDPAYVVGDTIEVTVTANGAAGTGNMRVDYQNVTQHKDNSGTAAFGTVSGSCYFKAGNYHQSCSQTFVDGTTNPTCAGKGFPLSNGFTWEPDTDRALTSELILYNLTVTPKGN